MAETCKESFFILPVVSRYFYDTIDTCNIGSMTNESKHLKKSNAACFYMPIVLKLLIIVHMW